MKDKIEKLIKDFVGTYQEKRQTVTGWGEPLIAYADAKDPLFNKLKENISSSHVLPTELMPEAKTVITYFLPFPQEVVLSNSEMSENSEKSESLEKSKNNISGKGSESREADKSSELWARSYLETNMLIRELNEYIKARLVDWHYTAVVLPPTHNFDEKNLISDWSHKHVAYIAGLGGFGLHRMLITEKGCCGRLGSIVTDLQLEPTKRPEKEYCLYKYNGTCKKCVEKCVNGALGIATYDRHKCYEVLLKNVEYHAKIGYADVCGKCISQVPCSFINPVADLGDK